MNKEKIETYNDLYEYIYDLTEIGIEQRSDIVLYLLSCLVTKDIDEEVKKRLDFLVNVTNLANEQLENSFMRTCQEETEAFPFILEKVRDVDKLMERGDYYMHLLDNYVLYPLQYESQSLSKNMQKVNNMQARFVEQEIKQKVLTITK